WSKTDLEEAHWLGCSYVITRVVGNVADNRADAVRGRAMETNSFLLTGTSEEDKRLEPEPVEVAAGVGVG
ncbi:MAG TPA: hypothetical protein VND66_05795, partial [Acidobacteriaceae bacterium]|nr:hypothetical protein [Acidobacteriaceae bacterium]